MQDHCIHLACHLRKNNLVHVPWHQNDFTSRPGHYHTTITGTIHVQNFNNICYVTLNISSDIDKWIVRARAVKASQILYREISKAVYKGNILYEWVILYREKISQVCTDEMRGQTRYRQEFAHVSATLLLSCTVKKYTETRWRKVQANSGCVFLGTQICIIYWKIIFADVRYCSYTTRGNVPKYYSCDPKILFNT